MSEHTIPTLYEWAGGRPAIQRLLHCFYERVHEDPVLAEVFAGMSPEHSEHVASFISEVFGGPALYSGDATHSHSTMVAKHLGRHLTEEQRQRWMHLLLDTADEVGLASDPEFRSALVGYLEWGSRIAVINSQNTDNPIGASAPMPKWGWGEPGGPYLG